MKELRIISATSDQRIYFWDTEYNLNKTAKGSSRYFKLQKLKNGGIAVGKDNGEIDIFEKWTTKHRFCIQTYSSCITALGELDSGELISGHGDASLKLYNLRQTQQCIREFKAHTRLVTCVTQHSTGVIISGSMDHTVRIWNPTNGELVKTIQHESIIHYLQELASKNIVISIFYGYSRYSMKIWELITGRTIYNTPYLESEELGFWSSYFNEELGLVFLGGFTGNLVIYDFNRRKYTTSYKLHDALISQIKQLNLTQIVTSAKKIMKISNWKTGEVLKTIQEHKNQILSIIVLRRDNENSKRISEIYN